MQGMLLKIIIDNDQKDLFKAIHELYKNDESLQKLPNGWVDNHIFVVDFFLWFMGQHGYKLQQVRKKDIRFHNLRKTIEEMNGRRNNGLLEILKQYNKQKDNE